MKRADSESAGSSVVLQMVSFSIRAVAKWPQSFITDHLGALGHREPIILLWSRSSLALRNRDSYQCSRTLTEQRQLRPVGILIRECIGPYNATQQRKRPAVAHCEALDSPAFGEFFGCLYTLTMLPLGDYATLLATRLTTEVPCFA